ncbi:MAG TPA: hypothetical protein VM406_11260 [Noviherbaspirillum sp.]|nr:hypothetical protein [Noviherbaspirillum sp.]
MLNLRLAPIWHGFLGALLLAASGLVAADRTAVGGVYVAGQGFTIEQALAQALNEQQQGAPFWILAAGDEARRIVDAGRADTRMLLAEIRDRGGLVYACERDLPPGKEIALPAGVGVVAPPANGAPRLFAPAEIEDDEPLLPESVRQNRLMLRTCAAFH